jgi:hypothetical protein
MSNHGLLEVATGRFYVDGEPEVRLRMKIPAVYADDNLLSITTLMGDGDTTVGLTYSLFATGSLDLMEAQPLAIEEIAARVEASSGHVISQDVRSISKKPGDVVRFVVVEMLREAASHF